ncbi:MAG TPA: GxxExxY protein [Opitutaceae bacterium]|nr:GxxExxY protein [Opitutaceae bacterium]
MNTEGHRWDGPHAELTFAIIGCAREVLNELGHGLNEKPCENALRVELERRQLKTDQQKRYEVVYKGVVVGDYIPDLIVGDAVIVDTKVIDRISDIERGQILNYLRISKLKVGLILNFRRPKLEWERLVL